MELREKKNTLFQRQQIIEQIRKWFSRRHFLEIQTPTLLPHFSLEENLCPFESKLWDHGGRSFSAYLRVSPELSLKKCLAAGYEKIMEIGPCYRNREPLRSPHHNPEFTLLEWYRLGENYHKIMDDLEALITALVRRFVVTHYQGRPVDLKWKRISIWEAFLNDAGLDLKKLDDWGELIPFCEKSKLGRYEEVDDAYYALFLNLVEPKLSKTSPTFLYDYPDFQASLARKKSADPRFAERFELYLAGMELANGFSELCDPGEQRERMQKWQRWHRNHGQRDFKIDEAFIACLEHIPSAGGAALGIDRLIMFLTNAATLEAVNAFSAAALFSEQRV